MFKNSREIFDSFLIDLVPRSGLSLAKGRPSDFAIYDFAGAVMFVALLQVGRAFNVRRFVGHIGVVRGESLEPGSRGRMVLKGLRATHIFNVKELLESAYIDELDVAGSITRFLASIKEQFGHLANGRFESDLPSFGEPITLTPFVAPIQGRF